MGLAGGLAQGLRLGLAGRRGGVVDHGITPDEIVALFSTLGLTYTRTGARNGRLRTPEFYSVAENVPAMYWVDSVSRYGVLVRNAVTNKITNKDTTNTDDITTSGAAEGGVSVGAADLGEFALYGSAAFEIDNSGGATPFYVQFAGATGATTVHSIAAVVSGDGEILLYDGTTETGAQAFSVASGFERVVKNNITPANNSQVFTVKVAAGDIAYVAAQQLQQAAFVSLVPVAGNAANSLANAEIITSVTLTPPSSLSVNIAVMTPPNSGSIWQRPFHVYNSATGTNNRLDIQRRDNEWLVALNNNGTTETVTVATAVGEVADIRVVWDASGYSVSIDGSEPDTSSLTLPSMDRLAIGSFGGSTSRADYPIVALETDLLPDPYGWNTDFFG